MKRLLLSLAVVGLIALPAMAQTVAHVPAADVVITDSTRDLEPYVYLENTFRNNGGWLSWYPYANMEFVDDISTIYSTTPKAQMYGNNMHVPPPVFDPFLMTGFDVGWYSIDTNTTHVQVLTVNFYDNPGGADSLAGYYAGTVWVPVAPTLLAGFTVTAGNFPGANFVDWDFDQDSLGPDLVMPADLWMGVAVGLADTGVMLAKDWGLPQPQYPVGHPQAGTFYPQWGWTGGPPGSGAGAEYGHSDWWWAAGWSWKSYFNGPPIRPDGLVPGPPYYDAYNPRGSFTYSIRGIPEPATLGLLALSGLAMIRRRR